MNSSSDKPTTSASQMSLSPYDAPSLSLLSNSVSTSDIEAAICRCLPDKYDKLKRVIFRLAREWKALCSDDGCEIGVREFVKLWFDAGGKDLEESFDVAWLYFLDACERVRLPKGRSPAELALERAKSNELPMAARKYDDDRVRLLVAVCRELQVLAGPSPFFLSYRMAGELIGVPKDRAGSLLCGLSRDGVLTLIAKGDITARGKLATRWRFIAE